MSALIKIQKNDTVKTVSEAAYKNYFKDFGWIVAEGDEPSVASTKTEIVEDVVADADDVTESTETEVNGEVENEVENEVEDEVADEEWDEAIAEEDVEKPLSEMNRDELVVKAESLGIEADGKNNNQLRKAIKEKM